MKVYLLCNWGHDQSCDPMYVDRIVLNMDEHYDCDAVIPYSIGDSVQDTIRKYIDNNY